MIKTFDNFILEKSIGSENIRSLYYSNLTKKEYYMLVNADPTSIRKKDFSKPGKYTKWLLREYSIEDPGKVSVSDKEGIKKLRRYHSSLKYHLSCYEGEEEKELKKIRNDLFIFSTGWFKRYVKKGLYKKDINFQDGIDGVDNPFDILKYSFKKFRSFIRSIEGDYRVETEDAKYDYLYTDQNLDVLIPLNFSASYEISKNTQWCSKVLSGFAMWNQMAILYRVKFKDGEIIKITWRRDGSQCDIAYSKYPEIHIGNKEYSNPFLKNGNQEYWEMALKKQRDYNKEHWDKLEKYMRMIPQEAKNVIVEHYKNHKNK